MVQNQQELMIIKIGFFQQNDSSFLNAMVGIPVRSCHHPRRWRLGRVREHHHR